MQEGRIGGKSPNPDINLRLYGTTNVLNMCPG